MGKILNLRPDGHVFDVDYQFPDIDGDIGVSLSAGIESTILLHMLLKRYGRQRVKAFTAKIKGRRSWEAEKAMAMMLRMQGTYHYTIDDNFTCMSPEENARLVLAARHKVGITHWFNGAAKLFYHPTFKSTQDAVDMRVKNVYIPFIDLNKSHVIDLYFKHDVTYLLGLSFSCTDRGDIHCGECVCCLERARGFIELGMKDPATYACEWSDVIERVYSTPTM